MYGNEAVVPEGVLNEIFTAIILIQCCAPGLCSVYSQREKKERRGKPGLKTTQQDNFHKRQRTVYPTKKILF